MEYFLHSIGRAADIILGVVRVCMWLMCQCLLYHYLPFTRGYPLITFNKSLYPVRNIKKKVKNRNELVTCSITYHKLYKWLIVVLLSVGLNLALLSKSLDNPIIITFCSFITNLVKKLWKFFWKINLRFTYLRLLFMENERVSDKQIGQQQQCPHFGLRWWSRRSVFGSSFLLVNLLGNIPQ